MDIIVLPLNHVKILIHEDHTKHPQELEHKVLESIDNKEYSIRYLFNTLRYYSQGLFRLSQKSYI